MEEKFKSGDIVQLKSGGPKMTVEFNVTRPVFGSQDSLFEGSVACKWFDGPTLKAAEFEQDTLKHIEG